MGILNFVAITAATDVIDWDTGGSASASEPYLSIDGSDNVYWRTSGGSDILGLDQDTDILEWLF